MLKRKSLGLIFFIFGLITSCKYSNENPRDLLHPERSFVELEKADSLILKTDEVCPNITSASWFEDTAHTLYLHVNNSIYCFDVKTKAISDIISLEKMNLGRLSSFTMFKDTILIIDYDARFLVIANKSGELLNKVDLGPKISLPLMGAMPVFNGKSHYYFTAKFPNNSYSLVSVNKKDYSANKYLEYPQVYEYNWGALLFRVPYAAYNENENRICLSFPADHFLYSVSCTDMNVRKHYAGSRYIEETVPVGRKKSWVENDKEIEHFKKTDNYSNLLYDPYHHVYYRLAELKRPKAPQMEAKFLSVIILDDDLNIIGETMLKDKFIATYRYTPFVNKDGLHLQYPSSEDEIIFGTYKLTKDEE